MKKEREVYMKYEKNFIANVIVQLDFAPVKRFFETVPKDIIDALQNEYACFQGQPLSQVQMNVATGAKIETITPVWMFRSADNTVEMQLTQNFLKFNCVKFDSFDALMTHIKRITSLLSNDISIIGRLGLRFINQVELEGTKTEDCCKYITDALTLPAQQWAGDAKGNIVNSVGQMILNYEDCMLNFNYGMYDPAIPKYLLDFDCYGVNVEFVKLEETLQKYNAKIAESFEKSIKDDLREKMVKVSE